MSRKMIRYVLVEEVPAWNSALIGSYRGFQDDEREGCSSREDDTDENIGDDAGVVDADADVNAVDREDGGEDN